MVLTGAGKAHFLCFLKSMLSPWRKSTRRNTVSAVHVADAVRKGGDQLDLR